MEFGPVKIYGGDDFGCQESEFLLLASVVIEFRAHRSQVLLPPMQSVVGMCQQRIQHFVNILLLSIPPWSRQSAMGIASRQDASVSINDSFASAAVSRVPLHPFFRHSPSPVGVAG
ncbi:MAG: hypothetical protein IPL58_10845 [Betaproteobacteria bacterium]|uniref:Uncharacterized protein n=1 Tax=Candidatus Proximibacter danicus TaxID=2954365 RepID=A0A9D7K190_9PROT|nr:hypothetical protein [Candidatus Proximibacter danicus]